MNSVPAVCGVAAGLVAPVAIAYRAAFLSIGRTWL
jgi:hypothetical protein